MADQAAKLRSLVENLKQNRDTMPSASGPRIISITSGKGGVGKSNFTANLALALRKQGYRVLILDADFGFSNIDVILGVSCAYNLSHVLNHEKHLVDIINKGPEGVQIISGGSGMYDLFDVSPEQVDLIIKEMSGLDSLVDFILIDTGAGVSNSVIKMLASCHEVILVTTPEPTSIVDGYALLKTLASIDINEMIKIWLVVNKAESVKEADRIINTFKEVTERFLNIKINELGYILNDPNVTRSVKNQVPFILGNPRTNASKSILSITDKLLNQQLNNSNHRGFSSFLKRFAKMISS